MTEVEHVIFTVENHIATLTLNRPHSRNAISPEIAQYLENQFDIIENDDNIWLTILCAHGSVFCAGADLRTVAEGRTSELQSPTNGFAGITQRKRTKPLLAAVEGPAIAGGLEILLACDLIVASRNASFALPEIKRSLVPAAGGLTRFQRFIPLRIALELALTGESLDAERAFHFGFINALVESGEAYKKARELAEKINSNAPLAVRASLEMIRDLYTDEDAVEIQKAQTVLLNLVDTVDFQEGLEAFLEKRSPFWQGK